MFFKKQIFIIFLLCCMPNISNADSILARLSENTCVRIVKNFNPGILQGRLAWDKQKKYFYCIEDMLRLFVDKKIFIHDDSRDHFTKAEIFKMFHAYFEYETEAAHSLTEKIFLIKKILVGGHPDQLKDKEIRSIYKLMGDYLEIYFILHKKIPVFRRAFGLDPGTISPEEKHKSLEQLRKALIFLERAYRREKISYTIADIKNYPKYFEKAKIFGDNFDSENFKQSFWFLHNWFEGSFFPKTKIENNDWIVFSSAFRDLASFILYNKTNQTEKFSSATDTYYRLEALKLFISSLEGITHKNSTNQKGFRISNIDEMLSVMLNFFTKDRSSNSDQAFLKNLNDGNTIPIFTRTLNCFFLEKTQTKKCKNQWAQTSSDPVVSLFFEDGIFEMFSDKIRRKIFPNKSVFIEADKLNTLKMFFQSYQDSIVHVKHNYGHIVAFDRQFDHWLEPFFSFDSKESRIQFGKLQASNHSNEKIHKLINYQMVSTFLLSSYVPNDFFSSDNKGISKELWEQIIKDLSPALVQLQNIKGYDASWKKSFLNLFEFADGFLNSSNKDNFINSKELIDLTTHIMEALQNSRFAYKKIEKACPKPLQSDCVANQILIDKEILSIYPQFQRDYLVNGIENHKKRIINLLNQEKGDINAFSLLPIFVLIQVIEVNYYLIDKNQSLKLEQDEILDFITDYEEKLDAANPYITGRNQAHNYLLYSFKTGKLPFLTADAFQNIEFTHLHLHPERQEFFVTNHETFSLLIFDLYSIYKRFN